MGVCVWVCVSVSVVLLFDCVDQAGIYWFWGPVRVTIRQTNGTEGALDVRPQTNLLMVLSAAKGAYRAPEPPGEVSHVHLML